MKDVVEVSGRLEDGTVVTGMSPAELAATVVDDKKIVLLKNVFPAEMLLEIRRTVLQWGRETPLATGDDFEGNYHRQRAMVSNLNNFPHVFHDYNFNDFSKLDSKVRTLLQSLFNPLLELYNQLANYDLSFAIPVSGPYLHPQIIQYPVGGGFFGRHWHNLLPQKLGFIVSLSNYGADYPNGGTCFEIDGRIVDIEGAHDMGDICLWRYDFHHWVKQSDLKDQFSWSSENGRWVATLPYYEKW